MRKLVGIALALVVLPALADTSATDKAESAEKPPSAEKPAEVWSLPSREKFFEGIEQRLRAMTPQEAQALAAYMSRPSSNHCYFIRQVNSDLKKPGKPQLVPLASEAAPIANSSRNCMTDSIVRKAADK